MRLSTDYTIAHKQVNLCNIASKCLKAGRILIITGLCTAALGIGAYVANGFLPYAGIVAVPLTVAGATLIVAGMIVTVAGMILLLKARQLNK